MEAGYKNKFKLSTVKILSLLVLLFVFFFVIGFYFYSKDKELLKKDKYNELLAISDSKIAQLANLNTNSLADVSYLTTTEPLLQFIRELAKGDRTNANLLRENYKAFLSSERYESILLADSMGNVLLEASHAHSSYSIAQHNGMLLDSSSLVGVKKVFRTETYFLNELFDNKFKSTPYYEFVSPVFDQNNNVVATLLLCLDFTKYIYPILNQWGKFHNTSESVLARRVGNSVLILSQINDVNNEVSFVKTFQNISSNLNSKNEKKVKNTQDSLGFSSGMDLTDKHVLAKHTMIPGSQWFLVERSDSSQIYNQINKKALFIAIIGAVIFLFSIFALFGLRLNAKRKLEQSLLESEKKEEEFRRSLAEIRSELLSYSVKNSLENTLREMQDRVGAVMSSPICFVHFLEPDQENIFLTAWSSETERQSEQLFGKITHNPVSSAGVWADAVRLKKPIIHNDFSTLPNKKGLPLDHPPLIREIIIPVIRDNKVVSVLGIANKPTIYDSKDIYLASFMADVVWEIAESKFKEDNLMQSEAKFRNLFYEHSAIKMITDSTTGRILDANDSAVKFYGWSLEELKEMTIAQLNTLPIHTLQLLGQKALTSQSAFFELVQRKANGQLVDVDVYTGKVIIKGKPVIYSIVHDVTIKRYKERSQEILYNITRSSIGVVSLEKLVDIVKENLSKLLDVSNLYVALYVPEKNMFKNEDFRTQNDNLDVLSPINSLKGYVFTTVKPLLLVEEQFESFIKENDLIVSHTLPKCWLAVPLVYQGNALGVLVLKSYTNANAYDSNNLMLMDMVGHELSAAIGRAKLIEDLVLAKEKAEESNRLKSAFLSNLSHEIRTPMNSIIGFLELLSTPDYLTEQREDFVEHVKLGADRLLRTLGDLIRISEIKAGTTNVNRSYVNVNRLLIDTYDLFSAEVTAKNIEFKLALDVPEEYSKIDIDEEKVSSILFNLLNNSLKFTQEGTIELGSYIDNQRICFYVRDTGCGISANKIDFIFNPFETSDFELSKEFDGIGLGLSIVKSYVESLGGKITVESKENISTTFRFCIPL